MEYNGKKIWSEEPQAADKYRSAYVDGINSYIKKLYSDGKNIRREYMPPEKLVSNPEAFRDEFKKMLGINSFSSAPTDFKTEYVGEDEVCRIMRVTCIMQNTIPMYALYMVPLNARAPMPLVIAQHGGGGTPELCSDFYGKNNYNHMVRRLLERGFAVLAPQLLLWSKSDSETMRKHDIPYHRGGIDGDLRRFGTTLTGLEISGILKLLDCVSDLNEIDSERIGMIGLSYGGYYTLYTMAADTRIKAGYAAGAFNDRDVYNWSDWKYFGSGIHFHDAEAAALCAPRRLYVQVGKQDQVFDYTSAIPEAERVIDYYKAYNAEENFRFDVWEGGHTVSDSDEGYDFITAVLKK